MDLLEKLSPVQRDWAEAVLILAGFAIAAVAIRWVLHKLVSRLSKDNAIATLLIAPIRGLGMWAMILLGTNQALQSLDYFGEHANLASFLAIALAIAWVLLVMVASNRFLSAYFKFRERHADADPFARNRTSMARKLSSAGIFILGGLVILRLVGADIAPFLAGGAIGGVIIGLALQESLGNVFAGFFLNSDSAVRLGDLIRLENGAEGFVERVGWRNTLIRQWDQTILVIPNSKFAQSQFTNLQKPDLRTTIFVECGVNYNSDLDRVEHLAVQTAKEIQQDFLSDINELGEPYVRWREFGASAVIFRTFIPINDSELQYRAKSAFIKRLHKVFRDEKIDIPFQTVTILRPDSPNG